MRAAVVTILSPDFDHAVLAWAACVRNRIVCVVPSRRVNSALCRRAAREAVERVAADSGVEPEWPPDSDLIAEG